jgi:hypothetical protein
VAQPQLPPVVIVWGELSPAHWSMHVESALQDIEHEPVQRTVHVEPPVQPTLALAPTVTSQSDMPAQLMLHESPQVPVQVLPLAQASEHESPAQPESPMSQDVFVGHAHELPVQVGGGVESPPQATSTHETNAKLIPQSFMKPVWGQTPLARCVVDLVMSRFSCGRTCCSRLADRIHCYRRCRSGRHAGAASRCTVVAVRPGQRDHAGATGLPLPVPRP